MRRLIDHPDFIRGEFDTGFVARFARATQLPDLTRPVRVIASRNADSLVELGAP